MKKSGNFKFFGFYLLFLLSFVLSPISADSGVISVAPVVVDPVVALDFSFIEKNLFKRFNSILEGNKEAVVPQILEHYKALQATNKALDKQIEPTRDVTVKPTDERQVCKNIVARLRSKIDMGLFKTAHSFGQQAALRGLMDKILKARLAWAREGKAEIMAFFAKPVTALEAFFSEELSNLPALSKFCTELLVLAEALRDYLPNGKQLFAQMTSDVKHEETTDVADVVIVPTLVA